MISNKLSPQNQIKSTNNVAESVGIKAKSTVNNTKSKLPFATNTIFKSVWQMPHHEKPKEIDCWLTKSELFTK